MEKKDGVCRCLSHIFDYRYRDGWDNFCKLKSISPIRETCDTNLRERRYSVIAEHPDTSKTKWKQTLAVSGNKKTYDLSRTSSVYLPSAKMKNERHNAKHKILNRKRYQLTRIAIPICRQPLAVSGNNPPQR